MDREPAVAGRFYPGDAVLLRRDVGALLGACASARPAVGVLAPHAGYVYSGAVAGATYAAVEVPARAIVLCPNHTGLGAMAALWPDGAWRTPLGAVPIDPALNERLRGCPLVEDDRAAHLAEHAAEVQLPFLQLRNPAVAVAVLCLGPLPVRACEQVGRAVAEAVRAAPALVVASSDMSHYVSAEEARELDGHALTPFLALDPRRLHETVRREAISMCGVVPATVMLFAARELGAREAELVRYANSGEVNGDTSAVVGYAGAVVR